MLGRNPRVCDLQEVINIVVLQASAYAAIAAAAARVLRPPSPTVHLAPSTKLLEQQIQNGGWFMHISARRLA
jgi:hypothetical protein